MNESGKRNFLLVTIIGSFVLYSVYYYSHVLANAPFKRSEFKSIVFKYGTRDKMVNYYNSATGEYDYLDKKDSLIKTHLSLTPADIDSLHKAAFVQGLWDFPDDETSIPDSTKLGYENLERDYIEYNYLHKSKKVTFDANYGGPVRLADANRELVKKIKKTLNEAEKRQNKQSR